MSVTATWPSGIDDVSPSSFSIPEADDLNWSSLTDFLVALGTAAQGTTFQRFAISVYNSSPISSTSLDCVVISDLTVPGPVTVNLPIGTPKQVLIIVDGKGDAATNNITITPAIGNTIIGLASFNLTVNRESVMLVFNYVDSDWKVVLWCKP